MYKKIFAIHSWMGLVSGLVLLIVGLSGSILLFKDELDGLTRPRLSRVPVQGEKLPWDPLLERVCQDHPGLPLRALDMEWAEHPERSIRLETGGSPSRYPNYFTCLYLDPSDGRTLGREQGRFLDWLYYLHFELLLGWVGRGFLFFFGVALFLLGASGFYLYRGWFRLFTEPIRKGGSSRTFLADWHKLIGITTLLMLLVLGFTGAWMNYRIFPWFAEDWKRLGMVGLAGDWYNQTSQEKQEVLLLPQIGPFLERVAVEFPRIRPARLEMPDKKGEPLVLYGGMGGWGVFLGNYAYTVKWDPKTGKILEAKTPSDLTKFQAFDNILDTLHVGRYGGISIRLVYAFVGLAPGLLTITGFLMFLKRRKHP